MVTLDSAEKNMVKEKKLPKAGAKRFGHRSHISTVGRAIRMLEKGGFFERAREREKKYAKGKVHTEES
jgi:hypothetical protein